MAIKFFFLRLCISQVMVENKLRENHIFQSAYTYVNIIFFQISKTKKTKNCHSKKID